jgi:hypothetical protein
LNPTEHQLSRKNLPGSSLPVNLSFVVDRKREEESTLKYITKSSHLAEGPQGPKQVEQGAFKFLALIFDKNFHVYTVSLTVE